MRIKSFLKITILLLVLLVSLSAVFAKEGDLQEKIAYFIEKASPWGEVITLNNKTLVPLFGLRLQAKAGEILIETIPQIILVLENEKSYVINLEDEHLPYEIPTEEMYNALLLTAKSYMANADFEKARLLLEKILSLFPGRAENHALLGEVFFELYQNAPEGLEKERYGVRAFIEFAKALDIDPQNPEALLARAQARLEVPEPLGSPKLAIEDLFQAIQQNPEQPKAYFLLGKAYLALDNLEAAKTYFRKALELEPNNLEAQENLAKIEEKLQN